MAFPLNSPKVETIEDYRNNKKAVDRFLQKLKEDKKGRSYGKWYEERHGELQKIAKEKSGTDQGVYVPYPYYSIPLSMASKFFNNDVEAYFEHQEEHFETIVTPDKEKGGFVNMQEGGGIGIPPGADLDPTIPPIELDPPELDPPEYIEPDITSEVLPDETVTTDTVYTSPRISQPIDKTQGFYFMNPAPDETAADFSQRYTPTTEEYTPPTGSYKPPEDYVSPRISTSFADIFGYGGEGTSGGFTDPSTFPDVPDEDEDWTTEIAVLETFGTLSDAMIAWKASGATTDFDTWVDNFNKNMIELSLIEGIPNEVAIEIAKGTEWAKYPDYFHTDDKLAAYYDHDYSAYMDWYKPDQIDYVGGWTWDSQHNNLVWQDSTFVGEELGVDEHGNAVYSESLDIDGRLKKTDDEDFWDSTEDWFTTLSNTTLFTSDDKTFNITLGNIADDAFAMLVTQFFTGDTEKALIAGVGSFTATNVTEMAINKVWMNGMPDASKELFQQTLNQGFSFEKAAALTLLDGTEAGKAAFEDLRKHANNMNALVTTTATMLTSLALGADMEQVLLDGASSAAMILGSEYIGSEILKAFGQEAIVQIATGVSGAAADAAMNTILGVGGGSIAALIAFIRTGDIKQAAISGLAGGLLAAGNPWGWAVMGIQLLMGLGNQPSNKSGYASFDFDKFELNKYSQGDYNIKKGKPENVKFAENLMKPLIPYLQELEDTTGFDFKGDLQIHYSEAKNKGIYYTIGNRDQEGLSAREMFLNRLDYYDGRDQSTQDGGKVYRRRFEADEQGIADMYEALIADLAYIAENKLTDLSYYTGVQKSSEEIQTEFGDFDFSTFKGIKRGGKISLDRVSKDVGGDIKTPVSFLGEEVFPGDRKYNPNMEPWQEQTQDEKSASLFLEKYERELEDEGKAIERGDYVVAEQHRKRANLYIRNHNVYMKKMGKESTAESAIREFEESVTLTPTIDLRDTGFTFDEHKELQIWRLAREEHGAGGGGVLTDEAYDKGFILSNRHYFIESYKEMIENVQKLGIESPMGKLSIKSYLISRDHYKDAIKRFKQTHRDVEFSEFDLSAYPDKDADWDSLVKSLKGTSDVEIEDERQKEVERWKQKEEDNWKRSNPEGWAFRARSGGKISLDKGSNSQYNNKQYGFVNQKEKAPPSQRADDVPMDLKEGDFVLSQPAVALYGKDTVDRMLSRAATSAGTNLKSGGKVPVNVHNGEYVIPKELTKYIGTGVLNTMNDKGLMSVGERPNT